MHCRSFSRGKRIAVGALIVIVRSCAAAVNVGPVPGGFAITKIELQTEGEVPGIDAAKFAEFTQAAKVQCPVSKALAAVEISLAARLL